LPTSMVQDTVPISDMSSLRTILDWVQANMGPSTVLITHQAIYGWARAYVPPLSDHIVNYQYNDPLVGVELARSEGYSSVLMIWWVNGSGWHGQPYVPTSFGILMQKGDLALYKFRGCNSVLPVPSQYISTCRTDNQRTSSAQAPFHNESWGSFYDSFPMAPAFADGAPGIEQCGYRR
jgi:hypothetical protein